MASSALPDLAPNAVEVAVEPMRIGWNHLEAPVADLSAIKIACHLDWWDADSWTRRVALSGGRTFLFDLVELSP